MPISRAASEYNKQTTALLNSATYTKNSDEFLTVNQNVGVSTNFQYKLGVFDMGPGGANFSAESLIQMTLQKSVVQTSNPSVQVVVCYTTSLEV